MIKALFIACALAVSTGSVFAQAATSESPASPAQGDVSTSPAPAAGNAANTRNSSDTKKSSNVEVKREELGQKLLKRKMELDNNDRPNIQPAQTPDRARDKQVAPADNKGQKK